MFLQKSTITCLIIRHLLFPRSSSSSSSKSNSVRFFPINEQEKTSEREDVSGGKESKNSHHQNSTNFVLEKTLPFEILTRRRGLLFLLEKEWCFFFFYSSCCSKKRKVIFAVTAPSRRCCCFRKETRRILEQDNLGRFAGIPFILSPDFSSIFLFQEGIHTLQKYPQCALETI